MARASLLCAALMVALALAGGGTLAVAKKQKGKKGGAKKGGARARGKRKLSFEPDSWNEPSRDCGVPAVKVPRDWKAHLNVLE